MDITEIENMFAEMGLGSLEERIRLIEKLSINLVENSTKNEITIKTCSNTLNKEHYA